MLNVPATYGRQSALPSAKAMNWHGIPACAHDARSFFIRAGYCSRAFRQVADSGAISGSREMDFCFLHRLPGCRSVRGRPGTRCSLAALEYAQTGAVPRVSGSAPSLRAPLQDGYVTASLQQR